MDIKSDSAESYLSKIRLHLKAEGFRINNGITYKNQHIEYVAKRTKLEIDKFGFTTTAYLFAIFPSLEREQLQKFSQISFEYTSRKVGLLWPRSLLYSIFCFPVAIVNNIDTDVSNFIRHNIRKHWAAFEMPVIYSIQSEELYYFELTPRWGSLYWKQLRSTINYILLPTIPQPKTNLKRVE